MKQVGQFNNIPETLRPKALEPGQVVTYKLLCGVANPDDTRRAKEPIVYPQAFPIPAQDRIKDPESGRYFDIAIIKDFSPRNVNGTTEYVVKKHKFNIPAKAQLGLFSLQEGNALAEDIYAYSELCNYNRSNPNRDQSVQPLFERVDVARDSKEKRNRRRLVTEAVRFAQDMTEADVRKFAASMRWNDKDEIGILRDMIEEYAEKKPEVFAKAVVDDDVDVKALIKRAVDSSVITYDIQQHRIVHDGKTLIKLDRVEGADWLQQSADYCMRNQNGAKVLSMIKKLS